MKWNWAEQMEYDGTGGMGWNTTERHGTLSDVITSFSLEKRYSFMTSLLSYYKVCFTFIMDDGAGFS